MVLFNKVFDSGKWIWTKAFITFIRKENKATYTSPGAYRPISILSYIGKLLERILEERIRSFCQIDNIIDDARKDFFPAKTHQGTFINLYQV